MNPVDRQTVQGIYTDLGWITQQGPIGLGWDAAGVVEAVGPDVRGLQPGQRVMALSAGVDKPLGALAELLVVPSDAVVALPAAVSTMDAATLPLNVLTAMQALDLLGDPVGGRLLVTGAAGAVGGFALPLARQCGWDVVGLARITDEGFVTETGAELATGMDGLRVDAVLDAAGLDERALDAVADGGRYVGVFPPTVPVPRRGITTTAVAASTDHAQLEAAITLLASGHIQARHASQWSMTDVEEAFRAAGASGLRGRVTIHP